MNNRNTFIFATTLSACLSFAGIMINAGPGADEGRLAAPVGIAVVDGHELKGEIVQEEDGIYAVFTTTSTSPGDTGKAIAFAYGVSYLAPAAPFARMVQMPKTVKTGTCTIEPNASGNTVTRILVQEEETTIETPNTLHLVEAAAVSNATAQVPLSPLQLGTPVWTLSVSRSENVNPGGWAAVPPPTVLKRTELAEGTIVLATKIAQPERPDTP
ncbi:MAG: hypothetical protein ISS31_01560 [Kiritimatiellae bacterium]|nr:hypothetical protein [Kiritimatiellia bacterium]